MALDLDSEQGVSIQFRIWGYALTGVMCETAALVAEGHPELVPGMGAWDKTASTTLDMLVGHGDEDYRPARLWSCLPWLAEHIIRHNLEWPGL